MYKKKLIEVALPLEAINKEAAREKSIRHGHPSTLHLWWARRPLAACRAVLFAQIVDDPSAHPEKFKTEAEQNRERKRLFSIIEEMVKNKLKERIDFMLESYKSFEVYSNRLPVREKGKISLLNQDDIVFCESQGKKVFICTNNGGFMTTFTLNELEGRLNTLMFFRAHQAFIVNLNYIKEIVSFTEGSYILHLTHTNKNIILSRSRAKLLKEKMGIQ